MSNCVIFDMDGTLADNSHRQHHLTGAKKNWAAFNEGIGEDTPHTPVAELARILLRAGLSIIICTGREERYRRVTETWMTMHDIPGERIYMRADGDYRPDHVIKLELLAQIRRDGFDPLLVIDDRNSVVKMWRDAGLTCLQAAEGDF
jgi:phosphoglycolate phosphatase-like HAD superfamily hydrolase